MTRVLVPAGVLGLGFDTEALARGVSAQPDIICIDGGSTDSGPHYLGTGTSKYSRAATKAQWRDLMKARAEANVPLVIGSCGTCGTDAAVDWMFAITTEIAEALGQTLKVARLYSGQPVKRLKTALAANKISPLSPAPKISESLLDDVANAVALAGAEQIQAALDTGADIVLAGRTTDTAIISALPLARGDHPGAAWHGAKIAECGALCSTNPTSGVIMVEVDHTGFTVQALAEGATCTPHSVSAHMLYENADPFILHEPGGYLDVSAASYAAVENGAVRVEGSRWAPGDYTVKLEGARLAGYQTTIMAVLRDTHYVANARAWVDSLKTFLAEDISDRMGALDYTLEFRLIGISSALGDLETKQQIPNEVGVLGIVTASDQATASEIGKLINPFVLHHPLTRDEELPTFAFPYSPAQSDRGALYEFCLNHTLKLEEPMAAFRLELNTVGQTLEVASSD